MCRGGNCIGEQASYDLFTLGGPVSARGFSVGEVAACRRFLEGAVELRVPVLGRQLFAFYERTTDLGTCSLPTLWHVWLPLDLLCFCRSGVHEWALAAKGATPHKSAFSCVLSARGYETFCWSGHRIFKRGARKPDSLLQAPWQRLQLRGGCQIGHCTSRMGNGGRTRQRPLLLALWRKVLIRYCLAS